MTILSWIYCTELSGVRNTFTYLGPWYETAVLVRHHFAYHKSSFKPLGLTGLINGGLARDGGLIRGRLNTVFILK